MGLFDFHVEIDAWFTEHTKPRSSPAESSVTEVAHAPRAAPQLPPASLTPPRGTPAASLTPPHGTLAAPLTPPRGTALASRPPRFPDGTAETRRAFPPQCRPLFPAKAPAHEKTFQEYVARAARLGSFSSRFTLTIEGISFLLSPAAIAPLNQYLLDWNARAAEMARHVPVYDASRLVSCVRKVLDLAYRRITSGEATLGQLISVEGNLYPMEQPWWVRLVADGDRIRVASIRWEAWPLR